MNVLEKLGYGGITTVIGMIIVFTGLILLILAISIMSAIFKSINAKKAAAEAAASAPAPAPIPEPVKEEIPEEEEEEDVTDDTELVAVIAAALAAYDDSNRLVIRKVRRVSNWNRAARAEQVARF